MTSKTGTVLFDKYLKKVGMKYTETPVSDNSGLVTTYTDQLEVKLSVEQLRIFLKSLPADASGTFTGELTITIPENGKMRILPFVAAFCVLFFSILIVFIMKSEQEFSPLGF